MNDSTLTIEPLLAQVAAADTLEALESARVSLLGKSGAVTEQLKLLDKSKYVPDKGGKIGGGGRQIFEFQALEPGRSELELVYRRPFEKDVKPAQTFKITFDIK